MDNGFALGLDVGSRRIGLALTSLIARLPAPYGYIDRIQTPDVLSALQDIIKKEDVTVVVVGLPRDMSGRETDQTAQSRTFAAELAEKIAVPIVMQDEAVTSRAAEERLKTRGKPYNKGDIDAEAASLILGDYLALKDGRTA